VVLEGVAVEVIVGEGVRVIDVVAVGRILTIVARI
jgi:hypothetical protein